MGRIVDFNGSGKTIAASTTVTFTPADIEGAGVVAYHGVMTGVGNTFNAIDRFRVRMNGATLYDISKDQFRGYIQRFTNGRVHYPQGNASGQVIPPFPGGAGTPVDWRRFTIPFYFLDREKSEEADVCQFPVGALPTVEIVFNANAVAGSIFMGWTQTDVTPLCYPRLYSSLMNVAAVSPNARYPFVDEGVIRGIGLETTGLARARISLNGRQVYHAKGQPANSTTVTEDMMFLESEHVWGGAYYSLLAGTAALDSAVVDPAWVKLTTGDTAALGNSFVEVETTAAWSGVASAEVGIYSVVSYPQEAAA